MRVLHRSARFISFVSVSAILFVVAVGFGRGLLEDLFTRAWERAAVHPDRSSFATGVVPQVARDRVLLVWRSDNGERRRALVEREAYSAFVRQSVERLEAGRAAMRSAVAATIAAEVKPIEGAARARVAAYADWYFAWPTTYRLLYEAGRSGLRHALRPRLISLEDAIAADVAAYLRRHYEEKVLEPEITDARLRRAFADSFAAVHGRYLDIVATLDADFQAFVARHTRHLDDRSREVASLVTIDWDSQLEKLKTASHEKGGLGALVGAGGIATLAAVGSKTAPLALAGARGAAGRGALARLWLKLASPIAAKATSALGTGGTAAAGGALAGPLGLALGAGAGLLIDYSVNAGVELAQRERFVADVDAAVAATFREWREGMAASLIAAQDVWLDDTIQLLGRFEGAR